MRKQLLFTVYAYLQRLLFTGAGNYFPDPGNGN